MGAYAMHTYRTPHAHIDAHTSQNKTKSPRSQRLKQAEREAKSGLLEDYSESKQLQIELMSEAGVS